MTVYAEDQEVFEKFRKLAVTDPDEIEVCKTYYTNRYPHEFTCEQIQTQAEHYEELELACGNEEDKTPAWASYTNDCGEKQYVSLKDRNVGASYNPWLLFDLKEHCDQCIEEMKVIYEPIEDFNDYYIDYCDDYFYDQEDWE